MAKVIVRCVNNKKDIAVRTTSELVDMMLDARKELEASRAEAEDLHMELMERDCRVDELEKQVEWLRDKNEEWAQVANDQKDTIINYEAVIQSLREEVERWKRIASENVDMAKQFHHEALAAEEEYDNLRKMYIELRDAAAVAASHIRSNTVAN